MFDARGDVETHVLRPCLAEQADREGDEQVDPHRAVRPSICCGIELVSRVSVYLASSVLRVNGRAVLDSM